ncbi:MAG TPA: helix-turn-helix domain-containing GNAT family N-acetyltransferase [Streptosporangiaceae bacterium]|jgi:DNA-binding MarR family transcriptional regulator/GNAT superfamily N-acetyltransferase
MTTLDAEPSPVASVRAFNRFYTNVIGVLHGGLLDSPYTLTEARVLFELAAGGVTEVAALRRALDIDAGYLSRILARFEADRLIVRERSASDGRRQVISVTDAGRAAFAELSERQDEQVSELLSGLDDTSRQRLLAAMEVIQDTLGGAGQAGRPRSWLLRPPRPGDLGWVVQRHGEVYAREYGFDETFEHLVARIVADYAAGRDPAREAAWIAEVDGAPAGTVFCVRQDDTTAKLRLLLVEPAARGLGIGGRLVDECVRFAREAGYRELTLWTQDILAGAIRVYQRAGFTLVREGRHHSFGQDLVDQTWTLVL